MIFVARNRPELKDYGQSYRQAIQLHVLTALSKPSLLIAMDAPELAV